LEGLKGPKIQILKTCYKGGDIGEAEGVQAPPVFAVTP